MKSAAVWGTGLLVVLAAAYALGRWQRPDQTPITATKGGYVGFEPAEIDLGRQQWAIDVPITLIFGNWGDTPVTIDEVDTSCGCLVAEAPDGLEGRRLDPGDTIVLDLTLDTQTRVGPQTRTVTIMLANGETHAATIDLDVIGTWALSSDTLDFGDVAIDEPGADSPAQSIFFTAAPDQLRGEPIADAPWIVCQTAPRSENRTEMLVTLLRQKLPPGVNRGAVFLRTTSPDVPSGAIYVSARGIQQLTCSPAHVFLRGGEPQVVRVSDPNGLPVVLTSVATSDESIEAAITKGNILEVRNKKGEPLPELFIVTASDDRGRMLRIPVSTF